MVRRTAFAVIPAIVFAATLSVYAGIVNDMRLDGFYAELTNAAR
ncbi:MAG: hypothetical protein HW416_3773 [Chloroflexi bacterium]|nr:hypothetical protein [Chloroflexota bacterium]